MCARTQKMQVVLASSSPRRTELLTQGKIRHLVMPSHCEEVITSDVPSQVVEELSVQKAEASIKMLFPLLCRRNGGRVLI